MTASTARPAGAIRERPIATPSVRGRVSTTTSAPP